MMEFSREHRISCSKNGKVILATSDRDLPVIDRPMSNTRMNRISAERIDQAHLNALESYARESISAIYCPDTAVIDSQEVLLQLRKILESRGVSISIDARA